MGGSASSRRAILAASSKWRTKVADSMSRRGTRLCSASSFSRRVTIGWTHRTAFGRSSRNSAANPWAATSSWTKDVMSRSTNGVTRALPISSSTNGFMAAWRAPMCRPGYSTLNCALRWVGSSNVGSMVTHAPGTVTTRCRDSKYSRRIAVVALPSLFQFSILGNPLLGPGSTLRSRSSENRSMSPKPLEREVPPLNQTSSPNW
jgi:hypothetical protein